MKLIIGRNRESVWPVWILNDDQDTTPLIIKMTDRVNLLYNDAVKQGFHNTDSIYVGSELDPNAHYTEYSKLDNGCWITDISYYMVSVPMFTNQLVEAFKFKPKESVKWDDNGPNGEIPVYTELR